jgi:hydroxylamine reductase
MFCFQCEQTAKGTGCTAIGVCGKDSTTAALQDLLLHAAKGISMYAHRARKLGAKDAAVDHFVLEALFTTVTNVNFDPARMWQWLFKGQELLAKSKKLYTDACAKAGKQPESLNGPAAWTLGKDAAAAAKQGEDVGIPKRREGTDADIASLQELLTYGLKGAAAYMEHARILGKEADDVYGSFEDHMAYLGEPKQTVDELLKRCLDCGALNFKVMELLDNGHVETFGHPEPTEVRVEPVKGKCILVSGHDLPDLKKLLVQTEGKGINIYTHGEMLPGHSYPELKKHKHLVGNYGGAWQDQAREFREFPGAILMTTNCIQQPLDSYKNRIFTSGLVAWPGVKHIADGNFKSVIDAALAEQGFTEDGPAQKIVVGFGRNTVMSVAGKVIDAVKAGAIKHFFLIGGCDGARTGRNYYTELAQKVPQDCVILTLACGKYRFNKLDFGTIGGIPRLLDVGQCNDAYSAIQIAVALSKAFNCGVNDLPLSLVLSWYEQKAVVILLTLLHLGIKNIRIGPTLPAFLSPNVVKIIVENYGLKPIGKADEDLAAMLKKVG